MRLLGAHRVDKDESKVSKLDCLGGARSFVLFLATKRICRISKDRIVDPALLRTGDQNGVVVVLLTPLTVSFLKKEVLRFRFIHLGTTSEER